MMTMALTPMRGSNNQSLGRMHDWSTGWVHEDCYYIGLVLLYILCEHFLALRNYEVYGNGDVSPWDREA